jgi:hypothetical protein
MFPLIKRVETLVSIMYIILPVLAGSIHYRWKDTKATFAEVLFNYFLFFGVGIQGLVTGIAQIFYPKIVTDYLRLSLSPFLLELGCANVSFGILAIISFWLDGSWKAAAATVYCLFLFMTGIYHLVEIYYLGLTPGNSGAFLIIDIALPILFVLLGLADRRA